MFNDLNIKKEQLPNTIPVFPLTGALILPGVELPLNIFEPKYVKMVDDALSEKRLIGIIQPNNSLFSKLSKTKGLYKYGCAGRIRAFNETDDGRYLIVLSGISRFEIEEEIPTIRGYRRFRVNWNEFLEDFNYRDEWASFKIEQGRKALFEKIDSYLTKGNHNASLASISSFNNVDDGFIVDFLASYLPFNSEEKQLFLECKTLQERAKAMFKVLGLAEAEAKFANINKTIH